MWKIYFRVLAAIFSVSVLVYWWLDWEKTDWLFLFFGSIGCLIFLLCTLLDWPHIFLQFCVSCVALWNTIECSYKMQRFEEQQLLPYTKQMCRACQALLQQNARYCMRCGTPSEKLYCVKWCPVCQHRMPVDANYCPQCRYGMIISPPSLVPEKRTVTSRRPIVQLEKFPTQKTPVITKKLSESDDPWSKITKMAEGSFQTTTL